ncbi:hypothetical protein HMPREF9318_01545 [Streptococcus urinalis FB127-CNA-2]|uniref:DNA (cytosine-5-)-methyltransferase n=1 Tax=Streptococcus urinalis 2285-97 TaxID=764291 RepID=G5KE10_9STRE|nr:hypothetical protein STRUR_0724 [Streptococcus urinalis 2285-97]EKS19469.1 hypothetical protein HMPREF9318_01545 [Streptococcus urinalis FB127-CNA-2]QBX31437.1 hypothetical protein Javan638_0020 [Streptococcus phage Javan638]VEF31601.1 DNA methylase [Streptococcus urinalis]
MTLTFLDFFAGVGCFRRGLKLAGITCFGYYVDEIQTGIDKGQFTDMEVTYITEDTNQLWEEVAPTLSK